ncbi:MAG: 2-dehydropantoate 2-reductase [Burkholderiaceae bacterium]|nr:2-dehydropantoate 2-reductase [Burkholderiaceae bacterium]
MRFAVVGAGSVGCYFGGMLARAGVPVRLIGRPVHVDAMRERGLRLDTLTFDDTVRVEASSDAAAVAGADVVLFCVKSTDSVATAREIVPHLGEHTVVLSLQNGVENAELISQALPQAVIPAVVYVATEMAGPGHLKHHGRGELVIAESPSSAAIVAAFARAGVPVQVSDNVAGALWAKLIVNCAYNALSAIAQKPYGKLVEIDSVPPLMQAVVDECLRVAAADGVAVTGDSHEAVRRIAHSMAGQYSSTAQDVARGKPNEIDFLNGYVVRRGRALGIPAPINQTLWTLVKLMEKQ